jgi:hypothetical protein
MARQFVAELQILPLEGMTISAADLSVVNSWMRAADLVLPRISRISSTPQGCARQVLAN